MIQIFLFVTKNQCVHYAIFSAFQLFTKYFNNIFMFQLFMYETIILIFLTILTKIRVVFFTT
jgi:hypothetical protein